MELKPASARLIENFSYRNVGVQVRYPVSTNISPAKQTVRITAVGTLNSARMASANFIFSGAGEFPAASPSGISPSGRFLSRSRQNITSPWSTPTAPKIRKALRQPHRCPM